MSTKTIALRQIPEKYPHVYLTFDDGPDSKQTPAILDILKKHNAHATFFVVGERAIQHRNIVDQIRMQGHGIGNHSFDHRYSPFFGGQTRMRTWIEQSEMELKRIGVRNSVGFRPPVGICTPELRRALTEKNIPLVLWNTRFFDSIWGWTPEQAQRAILSLSPGDILLLHDVQKKRHWHDFIEALDIFLAEATALGWIFLPLTQDLCMNVTYRTSHLKLKHVSE